MNTQELREALDLVSDGPLLKEMTRHNAADFVGAIASLADAARTFALPILEKSKLVEQFTDEIDLSIYRSGKWNRGDSRALASRLLAALNPESVEP